MFTNLLIQLHFIPQAVIVTVMLLMAYLFIAEHKENTAEIIKKYIVKHYRITAFLFYTALLITGTILGRPLTNPYTNILGYFGFYYSELHLFNYVGLENILLFIPYTYLFIVAFKPVQTVKKCFYLTIITTVLIELCQLLFWLGQFAIADIIHNTIGGMIGCGIWYFTRYILKHLKKGSN